MGSGDQPGRVLVLRPCGRGDAGGGVETRYVPTPDAFGPGGTKSDPGRLDGLARLGGSALTLALVRDAHRRGRRALGLAVGPATRRGLASSGRVHVGGVSPLTGAYTEGAVGGDPAWALAGFADGLVVESAVPRAVGRPQVLVVDARGADEATGAAPVVTAFDLGELAGEGAESAGLLDLAPILADALGERLGADAQALSLLLAGPAARAGLPYTTVTAWSSGHPPLVTGRGGLGLLLADLGVAALVLVPRAAASPDEGGGRGGAGAGLQAGEGGSPSGGRPPVRTEGLDPYAGAGPGPRLAERARAGTFELFGAHAAAGDLSGRNYAAFLSVDEGRAIATEAAGARRGQHGCKGCPTPCGLVFDRGTAAGGGSGRGGARFSATWALGPNLGFPAEAGGDGSSAFTAALELLRRCDERGVDAREAGACLALLARVAELGRPAPADLGGAAAFGDLGSLVAALERLPALASAELAARLDLDAEHHAAQGQAARPGTNLAAVLGQVVSTGGNDPLRSFPFTVVRGRVDPRDPAGKGALVAWHEDLAAALDLSGFCGFSAAGLLVDGVLDLDALAAWILPERGTGADLLEAGRALVLARRAFDAELGRRASLAPEALPAWARADLERPGMLDGYRAARGLDVAGDLTPAAAAWLAGEGDAPWPTPTAGLPGEGSDGGPVDEQGHRDVPASAVGVAGARAAGAVIVRAGGRLGELLGSAPVELDLPRSLADVLAHLAERNPAARALLVDEAGRPVPAVWRDGRPVGAADPVHAGERLDLVLAIAGG